METEQGTQRKKPRQSLLERAANDWTLADASAVKALERGEASPEQQKRALAWILRRACAMPEWPYVQGDGSETHIHLGRHLVGHMIMKLVTVNLASVRRDPNADEHEPKS